MIPKGDVDAVGDHERVGAILQMQEFAQQWLRIFEKDFPFRHEGGSYGIILA